MLKTDEVTGQIIDCAVKIHAALGPGLLESVYESVMERQLIRRGLNVQRQLPVSFEFDGMTFHNALVVDLLVDHRVVVELKANEKLDGVHFRQLMTYLRLMNMRVGLLLNFGAATMRAGIHRVVNNYVPDSSLLQVNRPGR